MQTLRPHPDQQNQVHILEDLCVICMQIQVWEALLNKQKHSSLEQKAILPTWGEENYLWRVLLIPSHSDRNEMSAFLNKREVLG